MLYFVVVMGYMMLFTYIRLESIKLIKRGIFVNDMLSENQIDLKEAYSGVSEKQSMLSFLERFTQTLTPSRTDEYVMETVDLVNKLAQRSLLIEFIRLFIFCMLLIMGQTLHLATLAPERAIYTGISGIIFAVCLALHATFYIASGKKKSMKAIIGVMSEEERNHYKNLFETE